MGFPRLVYKAASTHVVANDEEQFESLIRDGWFPTVPEAQSGKLIAPDGTEATHAEAFGEPASDSDEAQPTRDELEAKAAELGIKFNPNIGDKKLADKIAEALAAQ